MHELGILMEMIKVVENVAKEKKIVKIGSVTLAVGEVSSVIPEYLTEYWPYAQAKTEYLKEAELKIEKLSAITICDDCGKTYETIKYAKSCPYCKSEATYLLTGNEFIIKEIEAC